MANTLQPQLARRKRDLHMATGLLMATTSTIKRDLFFVDPDNLDDLSDTVPNEPCTDPRRPHQATARLPVASER